MTGNKRQANQSKDQTLDRNNAALARSCIRNKELNENGYDAGSGWRNGRPIRVVRSHKLKNEFAPEKGFRYDGIYRVSFYFNIF